MTCYCAYPFERVVVATVYLLMMNFAPKNVCTIQSQNLILSIKLCLKRRRVINEEFLVRGLH